MANKPRLLRSQAEIEQELGQHFVVWCGMAVSAAPVNEGDCSAFPTGKEFIDSILDSIHKQLLLHGSAGPDVFALAACFAKEMRSDGRLRNLTDLRHFRKFEDLIGRFEFATTPTVLDALMKAAFLGNANDTNKNQRALGFLLGKGHVASCFTSNFDNGIESSRRMSVFVHPPSKSKRFTKKRLYKLHGDAAAGRYVTTLGEMVSAEDQTSHKYLKELLDGQTVLVVGYSGTGDIDLFPYLSLSNAHLVWAVNGSAPPDCANAYFETDLYSFDGRNALLSLARRYGWKESRKPRTPRDWRLNIAPVINSLAPTMLVDIVALLMFQHAGVEYVRLCQTAERTLPSHILRSQMYGGRPFIEVSAYWSVLAGMEDEQNQARKHYWRGFALWRLYRHREAAMELKAALGALPDSELDWEINELVIQRVYLVNLCDMLRQTLFRRKSLWDRFEGELSYKYIEDQLELPYNTILHGRDEERRLLARIILLEIDAVMGRPISHRVVRELIQRSEALVHNNPAFSASGLMLSLGPRGLYLGFRPWWRLMQIYRASRNRIFYVKGTASLLYALTPRWIRPLLCKLNNPLAGCIKVAIREWSVRRALRKLDKTMTRT